MNEHTLVFFDLETAGLQFRHPVTQIAAIAVDHQLSELDRFECKVLFDEATADPEALKKNSYDRGLWKAHGVQPQTAVERFSRFLRGHATVELHSKRTRKPYHVAQLVAHNAHFDGPFIRHFYKHLGVFLPAHPRVLCTLQRAHWHFLETAPATLPDNYRLETLCRYFDVPFHPDDAHDALYDVRATIALYQALTGRVLRATQPATALDTSPEHQIRSSAPSLATTVNGRSSTSEADADAIIASVSL